MCHLMEKDFSDSNSSSLILFLYFHYTDERTVVLVLMSQWDLLTQVKMGLNHSRQNKVPLHHSLAAAMIGPAVHYEQV